MTWFLAKGLFGLARWSWLLIAGAALVAFFVWLDRAERADDKANQELGAVVEREAATREVLERTEKGNAIREDAKPGSRAAYDECVRSARTPANCVGLLPEREGDQLRAGAE